MRTSQQRSRRRESDWGKQSPFKPTGRLQASKPCEHSEGLLRKEAQQSQSNPQNKKSKPYRTLSYFKIHPKGWRHGPVIQSSCCPVVRTRVWIPGLTSGNSQMPVASPLSDPVLFPGSAEYPHVCMSSHTHVSRHTRHIHTNNKS